MGTHPSSGKRKGERAEQMPGIRGAGSTQYKSKDIPQFAPNFTVYVLPPDVVCLYSEDRKFLLHGELYCALASAIAKGGKSFRELVRELEQDFPSDKIHEALKRLVDRRYVIPTSRSSNGAAAAYWASLGLIAGDCGEKSPEMSCAHSIDRRARGNGTRRRPERAGRSRRQALPRPDGHVGERLSRSAIGRIEPAAFVGPHALGARPTFRHFSPGGAGVQPRRKRLLDVSCRADEKEPGGQGAPRPQTGPLRRRFAFGPRHVRTERHPTCGRRDRESDRHRFSHAIERSHHQPRPVGLDHREALCGGPPAMSRAAAAKKLRDPAPRAGADRAWRRRQASHDERRVPQRFLVGHGCAFSQAREPAHRRCLASRADPSRFALEHQLLCHAQFFRPVPRRSTSSGRG